MSRHSIAHHVHEWLHMCAKFGEHLHMTQMPYGYYEKELPTFYIENNLSNITHLCDGKDTIIETVRKDDSLKRRILSYKTNYSSCRCINFTTPMGLSFEHTRPSGARVSEQSLVQWWGREINQKYALKHTRITLKKKNWKSIAILDYY